MTGLAVALEPRRPRLRSRCLAFGGLAPVLLCVPLAIALNVLLGKDELMASPAGHSRVSGVLQAVAVVWCAPPVVGALAAGWLPVPARRADGPGATRSTTVLLLLTAYPAVALLLCFLVGATESTPTWLQALMWGSLAVCAGTAGIHTVRAVQARGSRVAAGQGGVGPRTAIGAALARPGEHPPSPLRFGCLAISCVGSLVGVFPLGLALITLTPERGDAPPAWVVSTLAVLVEAFVVAWCVPPVVGALAAEWFPDPPPPGASTTPFRSSTAFLLYLTAYPAVALVVLSSQGLLTGLPTWLAALVWGSFVACVATTVVHTVRVPSDVHVLRTLVRNRRRAVLTDVRRAGRPPGGPPLQEPSSTGRAR